jgi:hypothetical protein
MGRIIPLPASATAAAKARLERERTHLKQFLCRIESVLEEHELFEVEPWLYRLQERIADCDARLARYG